MNYARVRKYESGYPGPSTDRTLWFVAVADAVGRLARPYHRQPALCSLSYPRDSSTLALKNCGRRIGRRMYYPASKVAGIIIGSGKS